MLKTVTLPSLYKTYPDFCPEDKAKNNFTCLLNEPLSFSVAYILTEGRNPKGINLRIESDLPISFYYAEYVPLLRNNPAPLAKPSKQGLHPDILIPKKVNPTLKNESPFGDEWFEEGEEKILCAISEAWQSLFFTVNETGKKVAFGEHKIKIIFLNAKSGEELSVENIRVNVINKALLPQKLICTNWFHSDCLCDAHEIEPMSDGYFKAVYNYAKKAAINGQNMLLTPCFTPALDTPPDCYRKKIQLVGVKKQGRGKYEFDFTLLKKYIDTCKRAGIKYFEHSHLFTQWGAKAAPQIWAEVNGKEKRIFGWDTLADGGAYRRFLKAYLPAVTDFFRKEGLEKRVLFHISDEPDGNMISSFSAALEGVGDMLKGFMVGDALSLFEYYDKGLVSTPIVATDHMKDFVGRCKNYWCYYTGGQIKGGMSNRIIAVSPERNRMLGVQMYVSGVKGFLHWGYNYYYDKLSHGYTNPTIQAGNYQLSVGTSYLVYPARGLDCYQSIRQKIFYEGILDHRALMTLEKLRGKETVMEIVKKHFGEVTFETAPDSAEALLAFREEVNRELEW